MGRLLGTLPLVLAGAFAGFAAAAAVLRGWLPASGDESSDQLALVAIFDGVELANRSTAFRGGSVLAWFGGVDLDLSGATLGPGATLEVRAVMGGIRVTVPPTWRIESAATAFLGGIDVAGPPSEDPAAPTLTITGMCVMGGVAIAR